jgi:uncharacterized Zn finger protein
MSPRENAATKAERLLATGRVVITHVDGRHVEAIVRGDSGAVYLVRHLPGQWSCSCTAAPYARCSHLRAVQLITAPAGPVVLAPDLMVGGTA